MRVLVASEDAAERQRASSALRARGGVEVVEATSGGETHQLLEEGGFDCVVIDGDMRPEGGYSVLYEVRASAQMTGASVPPSVMLMGRRDDRWLANWAGATESVLKPVDSFHLAERVDTLIGVTEGAVPVSSAGQTVGGALAMDEPPEIDREDAPALDAQADTEDHREQPPARPEEPPAP